MEKGVWGKLPSRSGRSSASHKRASTAHAETVTLKGGRIQGTFALVHPERSNRGCSRGRSAQQGAERGR